MKLRLMILFCLLVMIFIVTNKVADGSITRAQFKLPKLFDFENFKTLFKRRYSSIAEELDRKKIFLAKALRVFASGVAYKFRASKFYLAINKFSDYTPSEIDSMRSQVPLMGDSTVQTEIKNIDQEYKEKPIMIDDEVVRKQILDIEKRANEPGYAIIADEVHKLQAGSLNRRKRDVTLAARESFSMDQLIKGNVAVPETTEVKNKIDRRPESNNPNYEEPELLSSFSLNLEDVSPTLPAWTPQIPIGEDDRLGAEYVRMVAERLTRMKLSGIQFPDQVFVDHRQSNCLFQPHNQGTCASCYAFAINSYYQWAICKETGKLVRLSEQYLIDCGKLAEQGLNGCQGGTLPAVGSFYEKYGFELEMHIPYLMKESVCPYINIPEDKMGFFRAHKPGRFYEVPIERLDDHLRYSPLVIGIAFNQEFLDYGGGVHHWLNCCDPNKPGPCGAHAVLLIGHGREDGEEYWLIRNSFGVEWGEQGHYKMNKKSDCIRPRAGYMFATDDGININLSPQDNPKRLHPNK